MFPPTVLNAYNVQKLHLSRFLDASRDLNKELSGALRYADGNPPELQSTETGLQVIAKKRRTARRGYENRVVRVLRSLHVVERCGYVVYIQTEEHRGNESTMGHLTPHGTTCGRGWLKGRLDRSPGKIESSERLTRRQTFDPYDVKGFSHIQENRAS
jgi:hypothetical protein